MVNVNPYLNEGIDFNLQARVNVALAAISQLSGYLDSGTYTPQVSGAVNVDSAVTCSVANYVKNGLMVEVTGQFTADATSGTITSFEVHLPIASDLAQVYDLSGIAVSAGVAGFAETAEIVGSVSNNRAVIRYVAQDVGSKTFTYKYLYRII